MEKAGFLKGLFICKYYSWPLLWIIAVVCNYINVFAAISGSGPATVAALGVILHTHDRSGL